MEKSWEVPALKDELNRKTVETLDWLISRYTTGQLTDGEFLTGFNTIFNLSMGLVSPEVADAVTAASMQLANSEPSVLRRLFLYKGMPMSLTWTVGSEKYTVYLAGKGKTVTKATSAEARESFERECLKLEINADAQEIL